MEGIAGTIEPKMLLPPPPGTFRDREELIEHVREFGVKQGYVVTIFRTTKDRKVYLGCDRGRSHCTKPRIDEYKRKRKPSKFINCPFEAIGTKQDDDVWVLVIRNGEHNHEPLKDMSEHPYSRRFTEEEVRVIKEMTEAGLKPRQMLKTLKQTNPELQSTPKHLYNIKAKIRQGNLSEKSYKAWWRNRLVPVDATSDGALSGSNHRVIVSNFIGGKFMESRGSTINVVNPATQEVVSKVPLTTYEEFKAAVCAAKQTFPYWKNTPIANRRHIMFKLQELIRRDTEKLAMIITTEQGRTIRGARRDIIHGLEVIEHACGIASLQNGEFVPSTSSGIDTYSFREPLGVSAGICHSDFPATTPLWMFPIAIIFGNTFVLKPSEKNPGFSMMLATLAMEAGLPDGVLNVVHGTNDIVNHICDDDDIKAVSLVGSNIAGMHIHARAASRGKRVQADVGLKYSGIIMPDACEEVTLDSLVDAGFGAQGQRCMSLSTVIFVGGSTRWEEGLLRRAKALKVDGGTDSGADLGPVICKEVKDRICRSVQSAVESGATLLLDGRNIMVPGYNKGNFVGPTILCDVTTDMGCFKEEISGPVLLCMKADSLEDATTIVNGNKFVNGASIFTVSGVTARKFQAEVEAGLVGINLPVPVPLPFSSSTGLNAFLLRDSDLCGKAAVQFYTKIKTVTQQWNLATRSSTSGRQSLNEGRTLLTSSDSDLMSHDGSEMLDQESSHMAPVNTNDVVSQAVSLDVPTSSRLAITNQLSPPAAGSTIERDSTKQRFSVSRSQSSDEIYMPEPSDWNEGPSLASQRTEEVPQTSERSVMSLVSQRCDDAAVGTEILQTSESNYLPVNSKGNCNSTPVLQSMEGSIIERVDKCLNRSTDQPASMSQRTDTDVCLMVEDECMPGTCCSGNSEATSSQMALESTHLSSYLGHDGLVRACESSKTAEHSDSERIGMTMMPEQHQNADLRLPLPTNDPTSPQASGRPLG